ncbi:SAP30-binding protein isoform X1 [Schistocerca piceifrons]|uniref:SAP30-binding protein isoform X1 n=2 Tax=Schistocerca piceifrons TaxID=274613 RepID=UPI001F5EC353|nr:SAP30-binding protein isoform X1 [Schistocerca piceifrons]XP_049787534.1 SAP30-binding protein isoform X1 [Schistocerca cancellata]
MLNTHRSRVLKGNNMSGPSLALASLTATYTDSEAEDEAGEEENSPGASSVNSVVSNTATPPATAPITTTTTQVSIVSSKVARLVSYHDETVVSDDDEEGGQRVSVGSEEPEDGGETPAANPADVNDVILFSEPKGRCSNELQEKISRLHEKMMSSGLDMNHVIQQRKDFRNPSIYEKLIQFCSINELGTNYPAHAYDPLRWGKESFYEELARVQKAEMERREKERREKTRVEFVSGTAKRPAGGAGSGEEDKMRRKSKWDQVGTLLASNTTAAGAQAGILKPGLVQQPALTTSATGTKGTVISAFGSLPKKPRI